MRIDYSKNETAAKGRKGDQFLAHVAPGEIIVPPVISAETRARLHAEMEAAGIDPHGHTVGDGMSINPATGLPEFGFGKSISKGFKKAFKAVKKVVSSPIGQIGLAVLAPYAAPAIGAGLGLSGAAAAAAGGAVYGGGVGALSGGGLKSALLGAATGGAGGYLTAGGNVPGLGSFGGQTVEGALAKGAMGPGAPVIREGTGILGKVGNAVGVGGGGTSSFGGSSVASKAAGGISKTSLSNLLSGASNMYTTNKAEQELVDSQKKSLAALQPFAANGLQASNKLAGSLDDLTADFDPGDLQNDPGYQFNLEQGMNALNNSFSAGGPGLGSGAAIKAGQQFAQGLADTTYNNAFNRNLQGNKQAYDILSGAAAPGLAASGAIADVNTNIGNAKAASTGAKGNTITSTLSALLSGGGSKVIIGYNADGTPIFAS